MSISQVALISLTTTILVLASGFAFARYAYAHNSGHGLFKHSGKHCMKHNRHGENHSKFIDSMDDHLRKELNLSDSQYQSLGEVMNVIRLAKSKKEGLHGQWHEKLEAPLPEKLGLLEDSMGEGLSLVQQFRPVFDAFYASLDAQQKERLEALSKKLHDMKH